ncbi:MAG: acyl-CoA/acyl-ACP dehydrogenase, partial [Spirochaetales bacterium]|nr:acyl-CoA/acyl-ACP dehydrogenase [Spirochaetales bacterium]
MEGTVKNLNDHPKYGKFSDYINQYQSELREVLNTHNEIETHNHIQGISPYLLRKVHGLTPLSVFIQKEYGGWGGNPKECLTLLETASYESIAVGLMFGINGALFIDPVSKFAGNSVKPAIFRRFIEDKAMGGLMITEPDFGTDALSMQTAYKETENGYAIKGSKHWGGLTGLADFWIVTARKQKSDGKLARDIDMFICDMNDKDQRIEVAEFYQKLGLFLIPYGRNEIDIKVPANQRLKPESMGIMMMMDSLHRSRLRLSGIGLGFIRRILDEAISHTRERFIGGKNLLQFDQVQHRLAEIQTYFTLTSGLCHFASLNTSLKTNLSRLGLQANAMKAILTDMMQEAAQSLLQLVGAKGFRRDHFAGRAIVDCRPFQIFEGSNDVMYSQVSDMLIKEMAKIREFNLLKFLRSYKDAELAAPVFTKSIDISIDNNIS